MKCQFKIAGEILNDLNPFLMIWKLFVVVSIYKISELNIIKKIKLNFWPGVGAALAIPLTQMIKGQ